MKGRLTKKIVGTKDRPRLRVSISLKNIFAQIIDDIEGRTLVSASTLEKSLKEKKLRSNIESAKTIGELIGKKAIEKGIEKVVFDRGGKKYHGIIKAVADSARAAGLKF